MRLTPRDLGLLVSPMTVSISHQFKALCPLLRPSVVVPSACEGNLFGGYCFPYSNSISVDVPSVSWQFDRSELLLDPVQRVKHRAALMAQRCALPLAGAGLASSVAWRSLPSSKWRFSPGFSLVGPALIMQALASHVSS